MIDQIRLVGCQSWADTTISLSSNKINVIQAPNNTGKSVLFKILKISVAPKVYTARKRKKLIRYGCTEARAYFSFTDGCMAATVIQQTRVIYLFKETNTWESFVEPPKRMIDELGLLVNEKGTFIANIIDTDQNLLLVDSDAASTTEFINMLCNNATLDDYKEKIEIAKGWSLDNILPVEWELNKVTQELQNLDYVDVDAMQHSIDYAVACKNMLYQLIELLGNVEKLNNVLQGAKDYDKLLLLESLLETLEALHLEECSTTVYNTSLLGLCGALETLEQLRLRELCNEETKPPEMELVNVLENLEELRLHDLKLANNVPNVSVADNLGCVEEMLVCLKDYEQALRDQEVLQNSIIELDKEFRNSGTLHKCEIFGEVVFDGKECVPCDS